MSDRTDHVEAAKERNEAQARAERGPARMSRGVSDKTRRILGVMR